MRGCLACFILPRVLCVRLVKLTAKRSIFLTEVSLKECRLIPTAKILYSSDEPKSAAVYIMQVGRNGHRYRPHWSPLSCWWRRAGPLCNAAPLQRVTCPPAWIDLSPTSTATPWSPCVTHSHGWAMPAKPCCRRALRDLTQSCTPLFRPRSSKRAHAYNHYAKKSKHASNLLSIAAFETVHRTPTDTHQSHHSKSSSSTEHWNCPYWHNHHVLFIGHSVHKFMVGLKYTYTLWTEGLEYTYSM